jgi:hypothetical protein
MILTKVTDFLKQNKKIMYYLGFFAFIYFAMGDNTFADTTTPAAKPEDSLAWFNGFIQIITTLVGLMTNVVWVFLNPGWTNATGLGFQPILKDLWIMVSNIVYFTFAILLIVIAFMNILGKGDKWELKQALPKFVIWVLMVPFSWFFVQLLLSISSILTASVLLLPYDVLVKDNDSVTKELLKTPICNTFVIITSDAGWEKSSTDAQSEQWCGASWEAKTIESLLTWNDVYGMLWIYTYGIFSAWEVDKLKGKKELDTFSSIFKLSLNTLLVLFIFIIYFILLISLCLALFVRGIWLWLYMIFSPVFWLLYFFWKEKDWFMDGKFSLTEFISLALVPVYVSGALAFWLLFIFVAWKSFWSEEGLNGWLIWYSDIKTNPVSYTPIDEGQPVPTALNTMTWSRITFMKDFHIDMYWEFWTSWKTWIKALWVLKSGIWTLIMQLFGIAVLWIAVMAALWASKITWAVVEPIAAFGKQVWGLVAKWPQYMPIFGGQSMESMKSAAWTVSGQLASTQATKGTTLANNTFGWIMWNEKSKKIQTISNQMPTNSNEALKINNALMKELDSAQDIINHPVAKNKLVESYRRLLKEWNITKAWEEHINNLEKATDAQAVRVALHWIDENWKAWFTILDGDRVANAGNMDEVISRHSGSENWNYEDKNPLTKNVELLDLQQNGVRKLKIDNDTQIYINANGSLESQHRDSLLDHLVDSEKGKMMKESDIIPWLEDNKIGKDDAERKTLIKMMKDEIVKIDDVNWDKFTEKTYFIDEDNK